MQNSDVSLCHEDFEMEDGKTSFAFTSSTKCNDISQFATHRTAKDRQVGTDR